MNSADLRAALNERVMEITCGFVPNNDDRDQMLWNNAILVIQRLPSDLTKHRVCLTRSTITVPHLRQLVCAQWRDDYA